MDSSTQKHWWQSKTFLAGCAIILMSAAEAVNTGLSWREIAGVVLGSAVVVFRAVATKRLIK